MNHLFLPVCLSALLLSGAAIAQPPRPAKPTTFGPSPKSTADDLLPPAPPIPEPLVEPIRPTGPAPLDVRPPAIPSADDDPFQQTPRDRLPTASALAKASEEFANKHYAQAAELFAEAERRKELFTPTQRDEWGYCRLYAIAAKLNRGADTPAGYAELSREVEESLRTGSDRLAPFGKQLLSEIRKRNPVAAATNPANWSNVETASFRIMYQTRRELAAEVGQIAEAARVAMYERWSGPAGPSWTPRCDIYLHANGVDYAKATGKPIEQIGHSTVEIKDGRVASRRMDMRIDDANLLDSTLPSEITQVILADMFADEPLPRWAVVGMAALSESPESVARYRRALPSLLKEQKLFAVGPFLERPGFTDRSSVTAFYAESISLVSYLVELRGPKAFTAFLRESPRRGIAKALTSHYGFRDAADLQERWLRNVMGAR
jgi:hypothetical protein